MEVELITGWLKLYNLLNGTSYTVIDCGSLLRRLRQQRVRPRQHLRRQWRKARERRRLGFHLRLKTQDGMKRTRVAFPREVKNPSETREVFVEQYSRVDLSVRFGDISGSQFGDPKGWLGNSVHKVGTGKYRLHAHVTAGDLVLKS